MKYREIDKEIVDIRNKARYFEDKLKHRRNRKRDENAQPISYEIEQMVWIYAPLWGKRKEMNKKLMKKWYGPYIIIRKISENVVEVINQQDPRQKARMHVSRVKPFRGYPRPNEKMKNIQDMDSTEEWEVEKIIATNKRSNGHEYLVKWKGYEKPTWEDEKNMTHCQE